MTQEELLDDLTFWRESKTELKRAYRSLASGAVKQYTIGSRSMTKFDLKDILFQINQADAKIAELECRVDGYARRKSVRVVPRDL